MIKRVYTIFDRKSGFYSPEFITHDNDECAKRWFDSYLSSVKDSSPNAPIVMYPGDFELCCLGSFDMSDCELLPFTKPSVVASAASFLIPFVSEV